MAIDNLKIIGFLGALNVASLCFYAMEYKHTGTVITTSGQNVKGHHEIPAVVAFLASTHQIWFTKKNGWHPLIGWIAIISTLVCVTFVVPNFEAAIQTEFKWVDAVKKSLVWNEAVNNHKFMSIILVWNEAVNIHQFMLYGPLLLYQLYQGYKSVKNKDIRRHERHMQSATMFLLGPLGQRFWYNHLTDRREEHGVYWQLATYSALMALIDQSVVSFLLRATLALAFVAAVFFVNKEESFLQYLLALVQ